ncbi:peptidase M48 [Desulfuromonas versatilis]|uniref:Peptidase M48 n=1 Tax=Desulfuromonas versatilis TaxID=2802975 RepID=A0ABN6DWX1_9BACT|nr:zinc metalloprotease HtpX [Desulfuromonas versatilis]BCR04621.1 peptidase M48 [Desulfuromonas versatilis]
MDPTNRSRNHLKSRILFALLYPLLGVAALCLGGPGFALAVAVAIIPFHLLSLKTSSVLITRKFQGHELTSKQAPKLKRILRTLSERAHLEHRPLLFMVPGDAISAFSVGSRSRPAIALSHGLLENLDTRELAGVLAHEVTHLSQGDPLVMVLSGLLRRVIGVMAVLAGLFVAMNLPMFLLGREAFEVLPLLVLLVAPSLGSLLLFALSRCIEFSADRGAAELLGDPEPLASALKKMGTSHKVPWWQRLFPGGGKSAQPLLRTHPTARERIQRLRGLRISSPFSCDPLFQD